MSETNIYQFDPAFIPEARHINMIKGLLVGVEEGDYPAGSRIDGIGEVEWRWVEENLPNTNHNFGSLLRAGYVYFCTWHGRVYYDENRIVFTVGFTDEGYDWVVQNLGAPADPGDLDSEWAALKEWAKTLTFTRKGQRASFRVRAAKTTSRWVSRTHYTPKQAEKAILALTEGADRGEIEPLSFRAYKAHITRRTAA